MLSQQFLDPVTFASSLMSGFGVRDSISDRLMFERALLSEGCYRSHGCPQESGAACPSRGGCSSSLAVDELCRHPRSA